MIKKTIWLIGANKKKREGKKGAFFQGIESQIRSIFDPRFFTIIIRYTQRQSLLLDCPKLVHSSRGMVGCFLAVVILSRPL
jgi:hypothetical protein